MKKKKVFILVILALVLAGISYAWMKYNEGPLNIHQAKGIAVSSEELYSTFRKDSVTANKIYNNKIVLVTGKIVTIKKNNDQQQVILLNSNEDGAYVNCTMEETSGVKEGAIVSIKGICGSIGQGEEDLGIKGDVYITRGLVSH